MKILKYMVLAIPLLAGCAVKQTLPAEELAVARAAVASAADAGAREYAELDLRRASQKLERAEQARENENYREALRMAEQAEIDARYAAFRARTQRAKQTVDELEKAVAELRSEVARTLAETQSRGEI